MEIGSVPMTSESLPDYANSANNDRYTNGYDGGDDDDSDDDEITSLDDFDVSSWDSTNDLEQIVDWFNVNYMYEEDELVYQVDDFLSLCDASPDYIDYYVAECVFDSAMNMLTMMMKSMLKSSITMTTVLMKTVVTNAGWTNGITMAMATMKKATASLTQIVP